MRAVADHLMKDMRKKGSKNGLQKTKRRMIQDTALMMKKQMEDSLAANIPPLKRNTCEFEGKVIYTQIILMILHLKIKYYASKDDEIYPINGKRQSLKK